MKLEELKKTNTLFNKLNFTFQDNKLILKVGESSRLVSAILFLTACMFFLLPISLLALSLSNGDGITFGSVIVTAIFFLLGFSYSGSLYGILLVEKLSNSIMIKLLIQQIMDGLRIK